VARVGVRVSRDTDFGPVNQLLRKPIQPTFTSLASASGGTTVSNITAAARTKTAMVFIAAGEPRPCFTCYGALSPALW
jgi:hypothetical protein